MDQVRRTAATVVIATAMFLAVPGAAPEETLFQAALDEAQNVPPTGFGATGTATLILNQVDVNGEISGNFSITTTGLAAEPRWMSWGRIKQMFE